RQCDRSDIVFGAAFSGRPADLNGSDGIVGPFVNNLPVRLTVDRRTSSAAFFRQVHGRLLELSAYQFTPLVEIQRCSEMPWRNRLFDSLVVFQNYLVDESARRFGPEIELADFTGPVHTNYPVTLLVDPGPQLQLTLIYDSDGVPRSSMECWARDLAMVLTRIPELSEQPVADLQALITPPPAFSGKAKRALRAQSQDYVPPQTEMERVIAGVWSNMFGVDRIGVEENFFDLGGHSLLLVQMHRRLLETLKKDFPVVALFEHPTISSLSRYLRQPVAAASHAVPAARNELRERAQRQREALAQLRSKANR
ncbi:MAG TPA: condensation domain-containing protein, partial [Bryobacteraceae bacterium]|nr:condensation domain-containing protein [Bryobacteraceae bacterium]